MSSARAEAAVVQLANGAVMPRLGLGTSPMGRAQVEAVVPAALEAGYRLFDTAENYRNEEALGKALRESGVTRRELFVTTKFNKAWHGRDLVRVALERSLERLGLDYVDLLLIHWPNPAEDRYVEAWEAMTELLEDGTLPAIGLSNFKPAHLDRLLAATGVTPDVNQIQCNPAVARAEVRAYDAAHGIVTESWSPLGGDGARVLDDPVVRALAERRGRTPAQVVLRWHLELGLVAIPKSSSAARCRENLDVFDFSLTPEDLAELAGLDRGESAAIDSDRFGH